MAPTPIENELMHRTLQAIEQMRPEVEGSARQAPSFPSGEFDPMFFDAPSHRSPPAQSAVYFCLNSASALLEVTRSLLVRLEEPSAPCGHLPGWSELSELSKAAGQSAYLAAVMLADPRNRNLAPLRREHAQTRTPVGARVKAKLKTLIGAKPA
ncbi:hypothetical protein SAMN05444679_101288 [Variovorax sp. CF079]|uniref:hypothetical protein n=1 Tax=Variovorax sp. CF079 TaxID=1882774 RepID=UPI00088F3F90|nr:hypothetical protein [Variovorax sp. CF079]SDC08155.1 hypothetical protein SAMN05444679_101288 [Variovorax sp. CF079]